MSSNTCVEGLETIAGIQEVRLKFGRGCDRVALQQLQMEE